MCGYYMLYNMYCFIHALLENKQERKLKYLSKLNCSFSYFRFQMKTKKFLIENSKLQCGEEAISFYQKDGPIDKFDVHFLLNSYPKLNELYLNFTKNNIESCKIFFGYGKAI